MKVAILGFGLQGRSAYDYYHQRGDQLTICDQKDNLETPPPADRQLGADYLKDIDRFDLLVRTSSMPPEEIVAAGGGDQSILAKLTTTTNEFLKRVQTPVIAVTGTKGKGTTSLLADALLTAAGLKVCLAGNIGIDVLSRLDEANQADVVVLELASYQTVDLRYSPEIGVILRIAPDHLAWHGDFDRYVQAKAQLFAHQRPTDKTIYFLGDPISTRVAAGTRSGKVGYAVDDRPEARVKIKDDQIYLGDKPLLPVKELDLVGRHNWENACAAIAACEDFLPTTDKYKVIADVLRRFPNPENHLEFIGKIEGVSYINDSSATSPLAAQAALEAVPEPKVLIVGGRSKGIPPDDLLAAILEAEIRHLIAIGPEGPAIARLLRAKSPQFSLDDSCQTMMEIVRSAAAKAKAGDAVLLSPGYAATHPPFGNFSGRARQFKAEVARLGSAD